MYNIIPKKVVEKANEFLKEMLCVINNPPAEKKIETVKSYVEATKS